MNPKYLLFILLFSFLISSCKTKKPLVSTMNHATLKLLDAYKDHTFSKETIQAKIKLRYQDPKQTQNITIKLRIKKDQIIWMSASFLGFPIAKAKITPEKVQYYEKIKQTYFDGDFSLLSSVLGREINFQQLQNILLGESLLGLKGDFFSETEGQSLKLTPVEQEELFTIIYWINPLHFKLDKQEINATEGMQSLSIEYPTYQKVEDIYFPKIIEINAMQPKQTTSITMDFKSVVFDEKLNYTFRIPTGYKELKL